MDECEELEPLAERWINAKNRKADGMDRSNNSLLMGVLIGAAVVALGVLAYFYYQRSKEPVVKIDVPGFQGEIKKDGGGVDIEVGKDRP
jgi:hypothetical protein